MEKVDLFILGILIGIIIFYQLLNFKRRKRLKRQIYKAKQAENEAAEVLLFHGYDIIESQKRRPIITLLDGNEFKNYVQADFIVEKKGKTYIVEVKTGEKATLITNSATRRQLLEYFYVYQPESILLLDMECGKIQEVKFHSQDSNQSYIPYIPYLNYFYAFLLGVLLTFVLLNGGIL